MELMEDMADEYQFESISNTLKRRQNGRQMFEFRLKFH